MTLLHRHLTFELYELALEEDVAGAQELRLQAARCSRCAGNLDRGALGPALAAWTLPQGAHQPVDWQTALRKAIAPREQPRPSRAPSRWRPVAVAALTLALVTILALPAAATAGPDSFLYPVRGFEEDARWSVTPQGQRPGLEAGFASGYLWQASVSAGRNDSAGYRASMDRFFTWAERLKADVKGSSASERAQVRATVASARTLVPVLSSSSVDENQAGQADSILSDVEGESQEGDGDHQGG